MKRKILIASLVLWAICMIGGGLWGRVDEYLRTRSIPPGQAEVQNLKDMYEANLFTEVLGECDRAQHNPRFAAYEPQILYVQWATDRRMSHTEQADQVQQNFLQRFPNNVLGADMHFSTAMNLLAGADYKEAESELAIVHTRYPSAAVAPKAKDILARLRTVASTDSTTESTIRRNK